MTLQDKYQKEMIPKLKEELKVANIMAVPRVKKIIVNAGVKEALTDKKILDSISGQFAQITGQKPVLTKARKSIATFKLRMGEMVGIMVTLRGQRMYHFLEKLLKVVVPRTRDFRGLSKNAFDEQGNYSLGIKEITLFPEIDTGSVSVTHPLQVVITTNAKNKTAGMALLTALGFPFKKEESSGK